MSGVKLKFFFISYRPLKTQKHLVSIDIYYFGFFMKSLTDNLLMQFFYVPDRTMCLIKKILQQYFIVFCPVWDNFSSENNLYVIT